MIPWVAAPQAAALFGQPTKISACLPGRVLRQSRRDPPTPKFSVICHYREESCGSHRPSRANGRSQAAEREEALNELSGGSRADGHSDLLSVLKISSDGTRPDAAQRLSVHELAKRAGVAANPVSRCENGSGAMVDTLARMQQSLEAAGVVFCFCSNWVRFAKTGHVGSNS